MSNSISDPTEIVAAVRARAAALGFDAVGIAPAALTATAKSRLDAFLAAGFQGEMDWLARNADKRADPRALWPEARSVVMLGINYGPETSPGAAAISCYALGADYHDVLKKRLKVLAGFLAASYGGDVKVFVDTAPVLEKALAQQAGLGWQGKHTNLVSRAYGSWLFLGAILTTLSLPADPPTPGHCGACRACLDACPTRAFVAPYRLDARRCISYLTIEHKGAIPRPLRTAIGTRIYGCDACLAACPWNKFARPHRTADFAARPAIAALTPAAAVRLDDAAFRALFRGSPIKRIGRDRFVRNALIALGNAGDPATLPAVEAALADPSALVRDAAIWALGRLSPQRWAAAKARLAADEPDAGVREAWNESVC